MGTVPGQPLILCMELGGEMCLEAGERKKEPEGNIMC